MASFKNSPEVHKPLFNPLILEKILGFLEFTDIKKFRLVCTFWNDVAVPCFTKKGEVSLEGQGLEQLVNFIADDEKPHLSSKICLTLFENYIIKINSSLSVHDGIKTMWTAIHQNIRHLTLHVTTLYASRELKWLLLNNFPSLFKLKIVVLKYWGSPPESLPVIQEELEDSRSQPNMNLTFFQLSYLGSLSLYGYNESDGDNFLFPMRWRDFFSRFPGILHLSLIGLSPLDITCMIQALDEIKASGSSTSIKSLEILDENIFPEMPNDDHFQRISNLNHSFESIHLEISPFTTTSILHNLIEKQGNSLKSLQLRRYPHPYLTVPITLTIPLQHLTFLEISDTLTPSLSFLPYMPSLKCLNIILRDYRNLPCCEMVQNTADPARFSHSGVVSLYIEPPLCANNCIKTLAICFPALRTLRVRIDDEMMEEICMQGKNHTWKSLENLHITSWDGLTDEGITGINYDVLKYWGGYSSFDAGKHRTKAYIGDIADLKSFTIEMWPDYQNHISDWSVHYGIKDLKNLHDATLIRTEISSSAVKLIQASKKCLIN